MKKIEINNFKAFNAVLSLTLEATKKNLLLYGENGSGKSSIFEAIKLIFYNDRLLKNIISTGANEEQKESEIEDFYNNYKHKAIASPIDIKINNSDFKSFNISDYHCYMLSHIDISHMSHKIEDGKIINIDIINLKKILENRFFPEFDTKDFYDRYKENIITEVNRALKDEFIETLQIGLENEDSDIFLEDKSHNLRESNGLSTIFNEARLHLVVTLLLLSIILKLEEKDCVSHKIIVLDDIVNSLDSSNRKFIMKYLLSKFASFQKFIFTHNLGFNNIAEDIIKNNNDEKDKWHTMNLYLTNRGPQLYDYDEIATPDKIEEKFNKGDLGPSTVGNIIRKRFEADLNEFCKIIHVGKIELSNSIIKNLYNNKPQYFLKVGDKISDANNLVQEIYDIVQLKKSDKNKISDIKNRINDYTNNEDFCSLLSVIKEFTEIERHFIHGLSHSSTAGMPEFQQKEMKASILLLKKFEQGLKGLKGGLVQ
ncbi:hypothetical protein CGC50_02890 [Capnocytophaga gingivalis]|jgi:hypothetical protein|uniref:Uncharacterized protein n=1 Tax=Capnocytophaga gingivalis TaxID=1017 RepID=A0A250FME0_9FLAO|nr:ATP-binding protein [Capnocytophaga gingivalis]ATA86191.1 hypothetical protein CGC50_02890 [Capnocytophaga gingivalis]